MLAVDLIQIPILLPMVGVAIAPILPTPIQIPTPPPHIDIMTVIMEILDRNSKCELVPSLWDYSLNRKMAIFLPKICPKYYINRAFLIHPFFIFFLFHLILCFLYYEKNRK